MGTRFVYRGNDTIIGFNFDIDLAVWEHRVFLRPGMFYIGIRNRGSFHAYHGVNANGNAGTLLYVHENEAGKYRRSPSCYRVDLLAERFLQGELSMDDAIRIVSEKQIVNVPDCSMQLMLSDACGRVLTVEPGIGSRVEKERYALITNYSLLDPQSTKPYIVPGDDRYERARAMLEHADAGFSVADAFSVLREVKQEGLWATRVSFVYSVRENTVYYVLNNEFDHVREHRLQAVGNQN
jgi:hypothetical protein